MTSAAGSSPTARAFDASVEIAAPANNGLVFLTGAADTLEASLVAAGGSVLVRLGPGKLLGSVSLQGLLALQRDKAVGFAGPVSIDPTRFATFAGLVSPTA